MMTRLPIIATVTGLLTGLLGSIVSYQLGWERGRDDDTGWKPIDWVASAEDGSPCRYMLADPQYDKIKGKFGGNTLIVGCKGAHDFWLDTRGQKYAEQMMKENICHIFLDEKGKSHCTGAIEPNESDNKP